MIQEKLEQLRKLMAEHHMDAYMIPTSDFHESEYVGEYFKCREFMTGFSGSAGTSVITKDGAGLWTDAVILYRRANSLREAGSPFREWDSLMFLK
jgi:Xaa-Pro aminopeptidase